MNEKRTRTKGKYNPICTREEMGKLWSPLSKSPAHTIGKYARSADKQTQYEIIDLGTYCVKNRISGEMLKLMIDYGNAFTTKFGSITPDDIKIIELYKEMKFAENIAAN